MSDFVGRIAARAVGAPALAQPRLTVFAEEPGEPRDRGLEVVDEEVVVAAPTAPRPGATAEEDAPVPGAAPAPARPAPSRETAAEPPAPAATRRAGRDDRRLAGARGPARAEPPPAAVARTDSPPYAPERAPTPTAQARPEAVPAPAPPAVRAAPAEETRVSRGAPPAARAEPPPVRVHIGRLEVRANLQDAPRPTPLPERREPERLSLSDYLRGRREP